jgi:hypothetical protein
MRLVCLRCATYACKTIYTKYDSSVVRQAQMSLSQIRNISNSLIGFMADTKIGVPTTGPKVVQGDIDYDYYV